MIKTMTAIAEQATNTTSIDKERLCEVFQEYFMNGDGARFDPISENRPKKPAKKLRTFLENLGFDLINCVLNQCEYELRIVTSYGDNFSYDTLVIDYWNRNIIWDDGIKF